MVDHGTAPAAAPARARAVAVGAAREHGHGDVEDAAARAARHEQLPPAAAFDLKTFERMTGMNVERPDGVADVAAPAHAEDHRDEAASRETLEQLTVVDVDVHVHEDPAALADYADSPWDVGLREIAKVEERYLDLPGISPRAEYRVPFPGGSNRRQTVESARELRQGLDELHVNAAILFPDHLLSLAMVRDPGFAVTLARAYNRWLREQWLGEEPGLYGALVVAPQDPAAGATEIRRHAGDRQFRCIYLPASGLKVLYGHEQYDPIYEAAVETGLPVAIHSVEAVYPVFPFQLDGFRTSLSVHTLAHPLAMVANLVSILETGVPVRYPELRIAFMEAGTAWVPWIANRLDKEYIERRREVPLLQERPSHYVRRFHYGTQPIEEPERAADVVKLFELFDGENRAMFASDWPHHDFDHPQHVFGLPFSPEARRKIMGENAIRFFGLEELARG